MTSHNAAARSGAALSIFVRGVLTLFALVWLFPGTSALSAREPMLIPGKSTLYERILTRPDAELHSEPGAGTLIDTLPAFEIFYVWDDKDIDGQRYLEVGRSSSQGPEGWMAKERTIPWRQSIVVGFNNPANRERTLIYRSRPEFEALFEHENIAAVLEELRAGAIAGGLRPEDPVVSIEPENYVDITSQLYILPILEAHEFRMPTTRIRSKLLRIASLPKNRPVPKRSVDRDEALRNFKVGITFVIDTTKSMDPYIQAVRKAIERFSALIADNPEGERFRFGLVGFRDNTELVPELEYVTKVFLPLNEDSTPDKFLEAITHMEPATSNSSGFNEDAIAGVQTALNDESMNWDTFGGRYIILVTDAGPRESGDAAAYGALAVSEVQQRAEEEKVSIFTMHLKTASGRFDHTPAEAAYRALSQFQGNQSYFGADGGDAATLERRISDLATSLTGQVQVAMDGELAEITEEDETTAEGQAQRIGRAMLLAYLGRTEETAVPEIFEGWVTDRDPIDRRAHPLQPFLLITRNQLSTLHDVMEEAIELGLRTVSNEGDGDFFTNLREAAARISRDRLDVRSAGTLGDLMGEYLEGLPYTSLIANITPEDWAGRSAPEKYAVVEQMRSRLIALREIHDDADRWIELVPDVPDGERVTLVPLSLMP
ncbi:vWA domain-containing protein [Breoghania sp. L-A4]|uniref:vWA domain-containing protein n=1 Tax=Breoghania sp. L-A4 TaxID=2304600 RepID=UPI0013C323B8|nr:vWA domain-containing protein [Breoghania sp. L-A4]